MDSRPSRYLVRLALSAIPAIGFVGLSGCSAPTATEMALGCPKVSIIRDLQTVTVFRPGAGRGPSDIAYRGKIADFAGNCEYGSDGVTVNLNLFVGAEKGPAFSGNSADLRYFVAVTRPEEANPAAKVEFQTAIDFPTGKSVAASKEDLAQRIPLPKDVNAKGWNVVVGFQLTPEQRDYNLSQNARPKN